EAGTDVEHDRIKQVQERVDVMGTVFLGSSVGCAQCHNHKYDPFSIKDYYSFMAFFNNTKMETRMGKGTVRTIYYDGADFKEFASAQSKNNYHKAVKEKRRIEAQYMAKINHLASRAASKAKAGKANGKVKKIKKLDMRACRKLHDKSYKKNVELKALLAQIEKFNKLISSNKQVVTRVMKEMATPRQTRVLLRGEHTNPGKEVNAKVPDFLHPMPKDAPANRLGLAQWLVDKQNPLLARAVVNRWWAEFFGKGLSVTLEDLGKQGEAPTHPELLDWLAADFKSHWSRKKLHKKIVMSRTYRQSSVTSKRKLSSDPSNKYYCRTTPLRLKAETIRDVVLQFSGLLSKKMYGPAVKPPQPANVWRVAGSVNNTYTFSQGDNRYRKGLYTLWRRSSHYPSFANFDAPDRGACTVRRTRSNTPLQALTLMNDEVYLEAATALAKRIRQYKRAKTNEEKINYGFRLCTSRLPDKREVAILKNILQRELQKKRDTKFDRWFTLATVLINMHETITRR
ncbi:MAG: DUF1553 domain-containing protein, partial [Lentisphaeraceae bacterium]|nr:DUF1553 domain-containing protein [Lentisphaeraceae bacterium]